MTGRELGSPVGGRTGFLDQLVQHERGAAAPSTGGLRPRLPNLFEQVRSDDSGFDVEEVAVEPIHHLAPRESLPIDSAEAVANMPAVPNPVAAVPSQALEGTKRHMVEPAPKCRTAAEPPAKPSLAAAASIETPAARPPGRAAPIGVHNDTRQTMDLGTRPRQPDSPRRPPDSLPASRALSSTRPRIVLPGADRPEAGDHVVEIHIGRIDVRAAPKQAEAPPAASAPPPSADRLAAYLQRRSRGGRS